MSYSVPTSPTMARSASRKSQPVTPQRLPAHRQHRHSSSQSYYKSPATPASPYTPLSLRSFNSSFSGDSSTLTTPDHPCFGKVRGSFSPEVARLATGAGQDQSLADIAQNWRSRASENGIKVSSVNEDPQYADDEASERTLSDGVNDSSFISTEEALLPPPFLKHQRRTAASAATTRPRSQSHVPPPISRTFSSPTATRDNTGRARAPPTSPLVTRRLNQSQNNLISTPPPNKALERQLKYKGSFTDPPHPRRREAFGAIRTPQNINRSLNFGLNQDTSLDLFDIDETDLEDDYDYSRENVLEQQDGDNNNPLFNPNFLDSDLPSHDTYGYANYNLPSLPPQYFTSQGQHLFADPFEGHGLSSIAESVEHHFQVQHATANNNLYMGLGQDTSRASLQAQIPLLNAPFGMAPGTMGGYTGGPTWVPVPSSVPALPPISAANASGNKEIHAAKPQARLNSQNANWNEGSGCSVCLASHPRTLAVLIPCEHPLCSTCLTSALNIVGEKDMECAVCRGKVEDFKLVVGGGNTDKENEDQGDKMTLSGKSFMEPLFSSPESATCGDGLESAFEFGLGLDEARASTPKLRDEPNEQTTLQKSEPQIFQENEKKERERGRGRERAEEYVVLRIDNVPWDITPPQIIKWLQQPVERVYVLLDAKGKTMSHAYVEVGDTVVAGRILRGEGGGLEGGANEGNGKKVGKQRERGSVLGKGRRARGVTITRSGQEELMADLFPRWRGTFDGSRPSLAGLGAERVIGALEGGLMGEGEVTGLLHLIREPDSHFLKVPSLPFHSLISVLSKFPTDVDSRVFWSAAVRDMLYDVAYAAVQILLTRIDSDKQSSAVANVDGQYSMDLVSDLVQTAMDCQAFTAQQISKFTELLDSCSLAPRPACSPASGSRSSSRSGYSQPRTPDNKGMYGHGLAVVDREASYRHPIAGSERDTGALEELAREFGVEAHLVQALAQRLAELC